MNKTNARPLHVGYTNFDVVIKGQALLVLHDLLNGSLYEEGEPMVRNLIKWFAEKNEELIGTVGESMTPLTEEDVYLVAKQTSMELSK